MAGERKPCDPLPPVNFPDMEDEGSEIIADGEDNPYPVIHDLPSPVDKEKKEAREEIH